MSSRKNISISTVLLDPDNARHGERNSQKDIYAWMCGEGIGQKVLRLAAEIAKKGNSPLETPAVIPAPEGAGGKWIVVEGNRRIVALKFLNNPKLCPDLKMRKQYERLKASAETPIPSRIEFVVFADIIAARYWIETRHGGENGGAGIIDWGPMEVDNFAARFGKRTTNRPAVELLGYAYRKGLIDQEEYVGFPVTTLLRLLTSPVFRQAIGCDLVKGHLYQIADDEYFDHAVATVLKILASGEKTVTDLKSKEQRETFAAELTTSGGWPDYQAQEPRSVGIGDAVENEPGQANPAASNGGIESGRKSPAGTALKPRSGTREKLFNVKGHGLTVPSAETKVQDIVRELATLKHSGPHGTPISVAFLFRSLVELSSENYLKCNPDAIKKLDMNTSLRDKVKCASRHMHYRGALSDDRLEVVLRHCNEEGGMLNINTLQRYLHSTAYFPNGETLNSMWSEIKDYVIGCW